MPCLRRSVGLTLGWPWLVAAIAGCGPEPGPAFVGRYRMDMWGWGCRIDDPEAPSEGITIFGPVDLEIVERDDGLLVFEAWMPPCPFEGTVMGDALVSWSPGCVADEDDLGAGPVGTEYYDAEGEARWEDGRLVLEIRTGRRFVTIPDGLPEWWDDPGHCSARHELEPID